MPLSAVNLARPSCQSIMVVDDSAVQRAHAVQLCGQLGIPLIYEAEHGAQALSQLDMLHLQPEVLLIDLHMPVMDGVELITQLHERGCKIPMLVVSSQEHSILNAVQELSNTLGLPLMGIIAKPLHAAHLERAFEHCTQSPYSKSTRSKTHPAHNLSASDLCHAIDNDLIDVHYQPKVDIRTGFVRGVEVLARWAHPRLGPIAPDQFIALAEKEQLIFDLTLRVLGKSLSQAAQWKQMGFSPSLAINLSPLLLDNPCLVNVITNQVTSHGICPSQVVLEITESAGVEHLGKAIAVLTRLRLKGFGLSLDDYGTGFSSMQQLARLPFTELKIDRSFVNDAHQRRNLGVILASALDMAKRLGLVSVAEGIETMEDWRLLQRYGCVVGQGYLIAKPMPANDINPWLRNHRIRLPDLRQQENALESGSSTG